MIAISPPKRVTLRGGRSNRREPRAPAGEWGAVADAGVMAVGRNVPIAPLRPVSVRPTRAPLPRPVRGPSPLPRQPAHSPRHHRGVRLCIPRTPRRSPSPRSTLVSARRAPHSCPVAVGRDVPIAPPRYIARGGSPPRCAALHPPPSPPPRCIARGGSPPRCLAWQVAHAESFAGASPCVPHSRAGRGVRSLTRGTAVGANHYIRALLERRDGRPWRLATRALPPLHPQNSHALPAHQPAHRCRALPSRPLGLPSRSVPNPMF